MRFSLVLLWIGEIRRVKMQQNQRKYTYTRCMLSGVCGLCGACCVCVRAVGSEAGVFSLDDTPYGEIGILI